MLHVVVYKAQMPKRLPLSILLKGMFRTLLSVVLSVARHLLVGLSWFVLLPWSIMAPFRCYFGWGLLEAIFPEAKGSPGASLFGGEFAVPRLILDVVGGLVVFGCLVFAVLGLSMLKDYMITNGMLSWPQFEDEQREGRQRAPLVMRNEFVPQAQQQPQQRAADDEDRGSQRSGVGASAAGNAAGSNWLSQVSPREYRTFLRRRELYRERQAQRQARSQFESVAQQNIELLRGIEAGLSETESAAGLGGAAAWESVAEDPSDVETAFGGGAGGGGSERTATETFDPYNLETVATRIPRGPLSHPSLSNGEQPTEASSLRRSVARTETFREPAANGVSFRENIRCRVCGSRTCIDREHVVQASQRYYQERQQQAGVALGGPMAAPPGAPAAVLQAPQAGAANDDGEGEGEHLNLLPFIQLHIEQDGGGGGPGMDFAEIVGLRGPLGNLFIHLGIVVLAAELLLHAFVVLPLMIGRALLDETVPSWIRLLGRLVCGPRPEAGVLLPVLRRHAVALATAFVHAWDSGLAGLSSAWPAAALLRPQHLKLALLTVRAHVWQAPGPLASTLLRLALGYGAMMLLDVGLYRLCVHHLRLSGRLTRQYFTTTRLLLAFLKMAAMLGVMLAVFPLWAGCLIDACTLPLFGARLLDRLAFHRAHPLTSVCLHHLLGMLFTTAVSQLVVAARRHVRPGLLHFIRNPEDPEDHLVRDILQRPLWRQLAHTAPSFAFYSALILVAFGLVSRAICSLCPSFVPVHLNFAEPLSTVPVDIVLQGALKLLFDAARPEALTQRLLPACLRWALRRLRLSSYVLGGRFLGEESFPRGGAWVFVPDFDRAYSRQRLREAAARRVQPIDIARLPIVEARGAGALTPHPVDFAQIPVPRRPAFRTAAPSAARRRSEEATRGFTVVFRPHYLWPRLLLLCGALLALWLALALSCLVLPVAVGRWLAARVTDARVHEVYTFAVGALVCGATARALAALHAALGSSDRATLRRLAFDGPVRLAKAGVLVAVFGLLWPLLFGAYTFLLVAPLLARLDAMHVWGLGTLWSVGMLGVKALLLLAMPPFINPDRAAAIAQLKLEGPWSPSLSLPHLTRVLILPITLRVLALALCPPLFILLAASLFALPPAQTLALQAYSHLISLTLPVSLLLLEHILAVRRRLVARIRDEHYLVGRQLHNLEPSLGRSSVSLPSAR
jgi:hypothetical protein